MDGLRVTGQATVSHLVSPCLVSCVSLLHAHPRIDQAVADVDQRVNPWVDDGG